MLHVEGAKRTVEYDAALRLKDIICRSWPNVVDDSTHKIWIIAGAKCYGQPIRDIDILLLANFGDGLAYRPDRAFSSLGQRKLPAEVLVRNLCAVIEVKEHSLEKVNFEGQHIQVYRAAKEVWEDATEQNEKQKYSIKNYIEREEYKSPWISNFIWLLNVPTKEIPQRSPNILGSDLTWEYFLNVMFLSDESHIVKRRSKSNTWVMASTSFPEVIAQAAGLFTEPLMPTKLIDQQGQEIERKQSEQEPQRHAGRAARERERAQAAEYERLRKAEAELLRWSKAWRRRNVEEGNEEEGKNIPLVNNLRLAEKEEQLRNAEEERKNIPLVNNPRLIEKKERLWKVPEEENEEEGKSLTSPRKASDGMWAHRQPDSQLWAEIAGRYLANKHYTGALEALCYAIQFTPNNSSLHSDMAYVLIQLRKFPEALDASRNAIRLNPKNSHAFVNQGAALNGLGKFPEALAVLSHAIQLNPNNRTIYRNIGYTLVRLERFPEALDALNRAIEFDPNDSPSFVNQGAALNGLGRYQEALEAYKKAEEIDPSNTRAKSERENLERQLNY